MGSQKKALITGISGQTGSYLAELLLSKGYEVHGIVRRHSFENGRLDRITHIKDRITLHTCDLLDEIGLFNLIKKLQPDELYNLAAMSHVGESSINPIFTLKVNTVAVVTLLEAIKQNCPNCKFLQASSSEQFGNHVDNDGYQRLSSKMVPVSPYGVSKLASYHLVRHYREAYGMSCCNSICYNHESPRRGSNFVTQKIINGALAIYHTEATELLLGNLYPQRDWSHAADIAEGQYLSLQHIERKDYVFSSQETHSVEEFCDIVFSKLGLYYKDYVKYDPKFGRAQELGYLKGDSSLARTELKWTPKYNFEQLIDDMLFNNIKFDGLKTIC